MRIKFFSFILFLYFIAPSLFASSEYKVMILDYGIEDVKGVSDVSINENGQVSGSYNDSNGEGKKVFFWDPIDGFKKIKVKDYVAPVVNNGIHEKEYSYLEKVALNNKGKLAVGYNVDIRDTRGSSTGKRAKDFFVGSNDSFTKLNIPNCINNNLTLIGINNIDQIFFIYSQNGTSSIFIWDNGDFFNFAPGSYSVRFNDKKECFLVDSSGNPKIALRFLDLRTGGYEDVFYFKGAASCNGLNNNGFAIGLIYTSCGNEYGYMWSKKDGLKLYDDFLPLCLNNKGQMVGNSILDRTYPQKILFFDGDEKLDLRKMLRLDFDFDCPVGNIESIFGINDQGQMVGVGDGHPVLLNPIDRTGLPKK